MKTEKTECVRMTLRLPVDLNDEVERWRLAYRQKTGMNISKNDALCFLTKQGAEASHG